MRTVHRTRHAHAISWHAHVRTCTRTDEERAAFRRGSGSGGTNTLRVRCSANGVFPTAPSSSHGSARAHRSRGRPVRGPQRPQQPQQIRQHRPQSEGERHLDLGPAGRAETVRKQAGRHAYYRIRICGIRELHRERELPGIAAEVGRKASHVSRLPDACKLVSALCAQSTSCVHQANISNTRSCERWFSKSAMSSMIIRWARMP